MVYLDLSVLTHVHAAPPATPASMVAAAVASVSTEMSGPIATWCFIVYAILYSVLALAFIGFTHYIIRRAQTLPAGLGTGAPAVWPGVSLIRPVYGADEHSEACFRTCLEQDYPGPVEYLFCLQRTDDPALPLLYRLRDEFSQRWAQLNARMRSANSSGGSGVWRRICVYVHPVREGFNGKTSNMYTGQLHSSEAIVVFQDSDLVLESKWFIRQTVMALRNYDCVYSPTRWIQGANLWARIYAFTWNLTMLTLHCTCTMLGSPLGLAGPTMAMPRRVLEKIGGVQPVASFNCEDMVLGLNLMKQGFTIGLGPLVSSPVGPMKFGTMFQNFLRGVANLHRAGFKSQVGFMIYAGYFFGFLVLPFVTMNTTLFCWIVYFTLLKQVSLMITGYVVSSEPFVTPLDILTGEFLLLFAFFKVLVVPTFRWGGQLWHVDIATAKMSPISCSPAKTAPKSPAALPSVTTLTTTTSSSSSAATTTMVPSATPSSITSTPASATMVSTIPGSAIVTSTTEVSGDSTPLASSPSGITTVDTVTLLPPPPSLLPSSSAVPSVVRSTSVDTQGLGVGVANGSTGVVPQSEVSRAFVSGYVFAMVLGWSALFTPAVAAVLAATSSANGTAPPPQPALPATGSSRRGSSSSSSSSGSNEQISVVARAGAGAGSQSAGASPRMGPAISGEHPVALVGDSAMAMAALATSNSSSSENGSSNSSSSSSSNNSSSSSSSSSRRRVEVEELMGEDDAVVNTTTTTTTTTTTIVRTPMLPVAAVGGVVVAGKRLPSSRARGCSMQELVDGHARAAKMAEHANRFVHDHVLRLRRSAVKAGRSRSSSAAALSPPLVFRNKHVTTSTMLRPPVTSNSTSARLTTGTN